MRETALFSFEAIPVTQLERDQGIEGPQGLAALGIADLPDDEQLDRYLAICAMSEQPKVHQSGRERWLR